jgi:predicted GIY-YIG superfamily endonuclease
VRDVAAEALDLYGDAIVKAPPAEQKSPWMFKFEPFAAGAPPKGLADATKRLRLAAAAGWEFSGTMEMTLSPDDYVRLAETKGVKPSSNAVYRVYVYKRPANQQLHVDRTDDLKQSVDLFRAVEGSDADAVKRLHALRLLAENQRDQDALQAERRAANDARAELQKLNALTAEKKAAAALNDQSKRDAIFEEKTKYSADLEQHIKKLQAELDALKADKAVEGVTVKPDKANQSIVLKLKTLDPEDLVRAVEAAAAKKFGKNALRIVPERTSMSIMLYGQPEAIKWATELIGKFDN